MVRSAGYRVRAALLAVALVLVSASGEVRGAEAVSLQLACDHQFEFAGYYVALWKGFYAEAGLQVEIRAGVAPDGSHISPTREVGAGRAEFGIGGANILVANTAGHPLTVLASVFQQSAAAVFARRDSEIDSPADLVRIAVGRMTPNDDSWLQMQVMLRLEGINAGAVRAIDWQSTEGSLLTQLRDRHLPAFAGYDLATPWHARRMGLRVSIIKPSSYGIDFYGDSLFTRADFVDRNAELVERFVGASLKGWRWALANPDKTITHIVEQHPRVFPVEDPQDLNRLMAERVRNLTLHPVVELGHVNAQRWARMHQLLRHSGISVPAMDPERFVFDPVRREIASQRLVNWILLGVFAGAFGLTIVWMIRTHIHQRIERKGVETLRASEERLRQVVENMPVLLTAIDDDGRFIVWNRECERVTGYSAAEIVNDPTALERLYPDPEFRDAMLRQWQGKGKGFRNWEWTLIAKDKAPRVIEWSDISKEFPIPGWSAWGVGVDATKRRAAEEVARKSEERYRQIAESASDWFWEMGPDLRFTAVTDRFYEVAGLSHDGVIGRSRAEMAALAGEDLDNPEWRDHLAALERHEPFRNFEYTVRDGEGRLRHIRISGRPVRDRAGNFRGYRGTGTDVTERREALQTIEDLAKFPEQSPEPVVRVDGDGMVLYANSAAEPLLEHWGRTLGERVPGHCRDIIVSTLGSGLSREHEAEIGDSKVFSLVLSPVVESGYVNIYGRDVTERNRAWEALRDSEERFRTIMEHAADAIFIHDLRGRIVDVNETACDMFGYSREELLDLTLGDLEKDYSAATMGELWEWVIGVGPATVEGTGKRKNGATVPIEMHTGCVRLGGQDLLLVIARDITDRKESEDALRRAKDKAEHANRAKSAFLAGMGHELRTPLTAIIGFSDILLSRFLAKAGQECREYASDINTAARELLELIDEILDLSHIDSDLLELKEREVDVKGMVTSCYRLVREQVATAGLRMELDVPDDLPSLRCDERRIKQVVLNLLANAIQFTSRRGRVSLGVALAEDGGIAFEVSDTGSGMLPEAVRAALNDLGPDDGSHVRRTRGGGLGIPLAKRLVEAHQGRLIIDSRPGEGTIVTVHLPPERTVGAGQSGEGG